MASNRERERDKSRDKSAESSKETSTPEPSSKFQIERKKRHIYKIEVERELKNVAFINWHQTRWPIPKLPKVSRNIWTLPRRPIDMLHFLYPQLKTQQAPKVKPLSSSEESEDSDDLLAPLKSQKPSNPFDVLFDSNFESGNMESAYEIKPSVFDVWLRSDSNAADTLWFHFRMRNQGDFCGKVRIRICNISSEKNSL